MRIIHHHLNLLIEIVDLMYRQNRLVLHEDTTIFFWVEYCKYYRNYPTMIMIIGQKRLNIYTINQFYTRTSFSLNPNYLF